MSAIVLCGCFGFIALTAALSTNFDFRAFYCAGYAVRVHSNPYHTEPLHTCERTRTDATFRAFFDEVALPAPQPAYDIAAFSLFAALPFAAASKLWTALLVACSLASIFLVRRLCGEPLLLVLAAFWLSLCLPSIYLGELVPICVCAIAAGAFFARTSQWSLAGIAAAATLIEPHIGAPVCLSVALWLPRTRLALALSAGALLAIAIAAVGVQPNIEYIARVLPAHALSEIGSDAQLSLLAVLHAAGVPAAMAMRAGTALFAAMILAGLVFTGSLARRFDDNAFIVAFPAALAVVGGVFMHVTEMAAALPLALLLLSHAAGARPLLAAVLVLLAVPWWSLATPMLFGTATGILLAGMTIFTLIYACAPENAPRAALWASAIIAVLAIVLRWHDSTAIDGALMHVPPALLRAPYPQASWKWFNDAYMATGSVPSWLLRAASWTGLCMALALALRPRLKAVQT